MPQKYPRTKAGMRKRRNNGDMGIDSPFNPHNGEPHTAKFIERRRMMRKLYRTK